MRLKRWQQIAWRWLVGGLAALVLLVAVAIGLFRTFAPVVPSYRARAEAWASQMLGRPVGIASIGAQWGLYGPELTLDNVELLSRDHRRVLVAARQIRIGFTFSAILHGRFARPNRIILAAPRLMLQRDVDGHYGIVGLEGSTVPGLERTDWRQAMAEAFSQEGRLLVRDGVVILVDMRTPSRPLTFSAIRINISNTRVQHQISGRLQLPEALGRTLSFALQAQGAAADTQAWKWQAQVAGRALDVPQWLAFWPLYAGRFSSGQLDVNAGFGGDGDQVRGITANISARHVVPNTAVAGFDLIAGSIGWTRSAGGWTLQGRDLQLQRGADIWPVSQFKLQRLDMTAGGSIWSGDASFVRLQDIVQMSRWLPPDTHAAIARLQQLSPSGDLRALKFSATRSGETLSRWALSGRFENLGLQSDGKVPGFTGLSGNLSADQNGGSLTVSGENASVTFAHLFRGPLPVSTLSATIKFNHDAQGWHFDLTNLSAGNADVAHVDAGGTLLLPADGSSPRIDLQASVTGGDARNKSVYFPVGIMPKEVVRWLDRAIVGGQVPTGSLVLRGTLHDFPYDNGQGLFDIRFHLVHGTLDYGNDWPPVTGLDADVEFKNQGMTAKVQHGMVLSDNIAGATARFADLRDGVLEIRGTARGSAHTALVFLRDGPIKERFGHALDDVEVTGAANLTLDLKLPVERPEQYTLDGGLELRNAGIALASVPKWPVTQLNGVIKVTQQGASTDHVQGQFLGEPFSFSLQPDAGSATTLIRAQGGIQAAELTESLPPQLQAALTGATQWQLTGRLPNEPAKSAADLSLTLVSNLQGLRVNLPAPFHKPTGVAAPLQASMGLNAGGLLRFRFSYDHDVDAVVQLAGQGGGWHFDRGELALGGGLAALPAQPGLKVTGSLPEFSLSDWKLLLPAPSTIGFPALADRLLGADVTIGTFTGFGQSVPDLHLALTRGASDWQIALASAPVTGTIVWPLHPDATHPIVADMQTVDLVHKPAKDDKGPPPRMDPKDVPPLVLSIKQLRYNDARLADLHLELLPVADGVQLKTFSIADPSFSVHGSGEWVVPAGSTEATRLNADLKSTNVAKTLQAFGFAPAISGNSGELQAELEWPGGPRAEILPYLNGKLHVVLRHGSLLDVKPGAGRIFGLLSINALPRRILLNFGDVLGKGFAYDSIEGSFTLKNGDAYTPDLTVSGPAAKVQVVGRTGLASRDFDEAVVVIPSVGSTLPVLGAIAGGVGVGAVVFLLTEIFKKPLSQVGETRYHLSGTWDNPKLTEIPAPKPATDNQR